MIEKSELEGSIRMSKDLSDELNRIAVNDKDAVISYESNPELMKKLIQDVVNQLDVGAEGIGAA